MGNLFFDLTIILLLSAVLSIVFRFFKQPPILSYILTGFLLGSFSLINFANEEALNSLSEIGITLLLFILGLELNFSQLKSVGKTSIIAGILQIGITGISSFVILSLLGFSQIESFFISLALTFSSTIIIVKLLSDKKDIRSLYGKISIGILLVQDFAAILALIFLGGLGSNASTPGFYDILLLSLKAVVLFGWIYILGRHLLPVVVEKIARSQELLFLFTLAWAFGMSALVSSPLIGFSIEIGGFLAGLSLAHTNQSFQIISRARPLRDFFITIFFVVLGIQTVFVGSRAILLPFAVLVLFVVLIKPLIVLSILGFLGHRRRTSFLTSLSFGQISEFSLILIFTGSRLGYLSGDALSLITAVGAVGFVSSTYIMLAGNNLYRIFSSYLSLFERKNAHEKRELKEKLEDHIVLIGVRKMGEGVLEALRRDPKNKLLVIDFDPDVIEDLGKEDLTLFGDIADPEIQEEAALSKSKLVISTISDLEDNIALLRSLKRLKNKPTVVVLALEKEEARELYDEGADYVVLPHVIGG
ncbi:MAG: cation:proton antiporter, partial [Patescibacteria group bacterium]